MPNIVISYRRGDAAGTVGWIHDKLAQRYGAESVFRDIDNIQYAVDFRKSIGRAIKKSDVLVAIMGPRWTGRHDDGSSSRIQEANDWVRIEIETAIQLDVPIIPLLIEGAKMPAPDELPATLRELAFRNALSIDTGTEFHRHIEQLITTINQQAAAHTAPPPPEPPRPDPPPRPGPSPSPPPPPAPSRSLIQKLAYPLPLSAGDSIVAKVGKIAGNLAVYYFYLAAVGFLIRLVN